ncbi:MAG: helix-turn-helix domain-containing protein [Bdellovibrionales bacterium]|nr:helix-turn-helix domain-containing protein [Bdellovibrionales bacterium]
MNKISALRAEGTGQNLSLNKPQSPYMTCPEAAVYLRKSQGAMRNLVLRKQITAYKVNRRLLFKKIELDRWIEKCRVGNLYGY